jgi:DNA-binding response OmpR family regulator
MLHIPELEVGDIVLWPAHRRVYIDGEAVKLTEVESYLLELLAFWADTVLSREMLCGAMYRETGFRPSSPRHVDRHICNLRRKLCASERTRIRSMCNRGYKLAVS